MAQDHEVLMLVKRNLPLVDALGLGEGVLVDQPVNDAAVYQGSAVTCS